MNKKERIELLNQVAETINHDVNGKFVPGETKRLELIDSLLAPTDYKLSVIGLCHVYTKTPLDKMSTSVKVISSHVDTHRCITAPFSELYSEKKLLGTYDNSVTNAAILTLMLEDRLPEDVIVAFTGNEEYGMKGASDLAAYLQKRGGEAKIIVTDVTDRSWKGKNVVSLENCYNSGNWTAGVKEVLNRSDYKWKLKGNYGDDESYVYAEAGFESLSFCIPTKGEMHDNSGLKIRVKAYHGYIEALGAIAGI